MKAYDGSVYPVFKVKYHGPTNTKSGRFRASVVRDGQRSSLTEGFDHAANGPFGATTGNDKQSQIVDLALRLREKVAPGTMPAREAIVGDNGDHYTVIFPI